MLMDESLTHKSELCGMNEYNIYNTHYIQAWPLSIKQKQKSDIVLRERRNPAQLAVYIDFVWTYLIHKTHDFPSCLHQRAFGTQAMCNVACGDGKKMREREK